MRCVVLCSIATRTRTFLVDGQMTLREAKKYVEDRGCYFSLKRVLQFYGLHFSEEEAFNFRYRQEFNLSDGRTVYDIKLQELLAYRDFRIGHELKQVSVLRLASRR